MAPLGEELLAGEGALLASARALDWGRTAFGPVERWPQHLRTLVSACLSSRFPLLVGWGPDLELFYNEAYLPILGDKHPRALGRPMRECWREIWSAIGPMVEPLFQGARATYCEELRLDVVRRGFLEECYFTFSFGPVRNEAGQVDGIFGAVSETTERVIGERRMRTLRALAERTAEAKTDAQACAAVAEVLAQAPDDVAFALLYVLTRKDGTARLAGCAGLEAWHPTQPSELQGDGAAHWPLADVARTGKAVVLEGLRARLGIPDLPADAAMVLPLRLAGSDATDAVLVLGASPRRPLDGAYQGFLEDVRDCLRRGMENAHALESERQRAEALATLDRSKTAFFSNISHELRTPLTLLLGPLEEGMAAARAAGDAGQRATLEMAHRNALRLGKLVNALLDFSRLEAGRADATFQPTDLGTLTADLASAFRSVMERAGLRFTVSCPPQEEPAWVDPSLWETVVFNLLSNALKHTLEGEVAVTLRRAQDTWELEVRDSGMGIPEEELGRLFERFHRVRGARARTSEGSGIGLALVQELARLHGGMVRAESRFGQGSTFTVILPAGAGHLPPERLGRASTSRRSASGAAAYVEEALRWLPAPAGRPPPAPATTTGPSAGPSPGPSAGPSAGPSSLAPRILLADDNADMREYLARVLGAEWRVEAVADGAAAWSSLQREVPDLVLSDVMMPGLDGHQLLRAIRADARTRSVPVLLLSARAGEQCMVEGLDAGADDYLEKPFSARELLARVRTHLALARARVEAGRSARRVERLLALREVSLALGQVQAPELLARITAERVLLLLGARHVEARITLEEGSAPLLGEASAPEAGPREGRAHLVTPLTGRGGQLLGHIAVWNSPDPVPAEDEVLLCQVAQTAAVVVDHARLHRQARQAEQEMQRQLELTRAITHSLGEGLLALDRQARIQGMNTAAESLLGWTTAELVGRCAHDALHFQREDGTPLPREECCGLRGLERGEVIRGREDTYTRKDGRILPVEVTTSPILVEGTMAGSVVTFRDITDRKRAEQEVRRLAAQLSEVEDAQRRRLAHDLHDSLGQTLSVVKLELAAGGAALDRGASAAEVLTGPLRLIDGLLQQVRSMTFDLHPAMLDDLGLVPTLRQYAEQFTTRTRVSVTVTESGTRAELPGPVVTYLFRAIKELLNNTAKHASAREVLVGVRWHADGVRVVVDDDGKGFDVESALAPQHRRGLGLVSIRERMAALGGRFFAESQPGEGTRSVLEFPSR